MKQGRPYHSSIRQNIIEILNIKGKACGYELHKIYMEIFPSATRESIYYNLRTGAKLGEFEVKEVKQESGEYSWGASVEKIYYTLGPKAQPKCDDRIKKWFEGRSKV